MANQGGEQERDDTDQKNLAAEPEKKRWQVPELIPSWMSWILSGS